MKWLPPAEGLTPPRRRPPAAVWRWLRLGWRDTRRAGFASLAHGLLVMLVSWLILGVTLDYWPLAIALTSAFVLVGPILATGLYAISRGFDSGRDADFATVLQAWRQGARHLLRFGLLLFAAAIAWVVFSVLMFALFVDGDIDGPRAFLRYVVSQDDLVFLLWTLLGGLGAALVFALSVIAVPLLVDRRVTLREAMAISLRAVGANPSTMVCWAIVLALLTGLSLATAALGFVLLYPLMGHASWRLYRDIQDAEALPARTFSEDK